MKNLIFLTFAVLTAVFFSSCGGSDAPQTEMCHTELVDHPLETAVVANATIVRTGQSISGVVKDHAKKVSGYTREMFLADNPHISGRKPITKMDPCDSTKVKYTSIPVHAGDTVFLRHPLRIDTIPGNQESINWRPGRNGGRIKYVIDMVDDSNRFTVSMQNITCEPDEPVKEDGPVLPPNGDSGESDPKEGLSQWWGFGLPWWAWIVLALLIIALAIWRGSRGIHHRQDTANHHSDQRNTHHARTNTLLESVFNQGGLAGGRQHGEKN